MGKVESRDGSNSIDRISKLPQEILHKILYFLSQKEAVRTSVLSKSWRYIWCTRPNLDFSDKYYYLKQDKQEFLSQFLSIVDKNLQRYYDQRLCVEELQLYITFGEGLDQESILLLKKWIPLLTNMGVKKFCLSLLSEIRLEPRYLRLPPEVFGAESLHDLHLERFMLDQKAVERIVLFKHLKSLRLKEVSVEDEIFDKIISSCPLIETMCVERCIRLQTIKANDIPNLKHFSFSGRIYERYSIEIYPPSLETINISGGNLRFHKGAHFPNLNQLYVSGAKFSSWDDLSSCKFPSLKSFYISDCHGLQEIKLFIDAPNIVYFKYEGDIALSISFATTSGHEWKSYIKLRYSHPNVGRSSWFLKLNELLESLSQSHISLAINQFHRNGGDVIIIRGRNNPNPIVAVEKFSLHCHDFRGPCHVSHLSSLLNSVFSICRPRNMKGYHGLMTGQDRSEHVKCLWKILMERESDDQFKHALWLQDFEGVSLEIKNRGEWRPTSSPDSPNYQEMEFSSIRFALKWKGLHFFRDPSKKPRKPKIVDLRI